MGRHSEYTPEIAKEFCNALTTHQGGMRSLCDNNEQFPDLRTIYNWLERYPEFVQWYSHAKDLQLQTMAEDIEDIANDETLDPADKRVRINAKQWLLSKLKHKVYGDKLDVTSNGETMTTPPHLIDARVQSIIMQAQARKKGEPMPVLDANALKLLE